MEEIAQAEEDGKPMHPVSKTLIRILIPVAIIAFGLLIQKTLVGMKATPQEKPVEESGITVRTEKVKVSTQQVTVAAQGTVLPARQVALQPEVAGRVIQRSESLVVGGQFKEGDVLLRIDPREYSIRAKQSASEVSRAEQQLLLESTRGQLAKEEWQIIGEPGQASEAALRKPQMIEAEARRDLASHTRDLALLNIGRTTLRAPFNGIVQAAQINVGQYVSPATSLGTLVGSDEYWVRVSVPVDQLRQLQVPGWNAADGEGSMVEVWQSLEETRIERKGQIKRLFGDVDPLGRLARVLVQIDDPLALQSPEDERGLPLLLGSYVHVDMAGKDIIEVAEIPRSALHSGRYVYLYGPDDRLLVREVKVAWRKPETVLVKKGLVAGDEVVLSRLSTAIDGLKLRRVSEEPTVEDNDPDAAPAAGKEAEK